MVFPNVCVFFLSRATLDFKLAMDQNLFIADLQEFYVPSIPEYQRLEINN